MLNIFTIFFEFDKIINDKNRFKSAMNNLYK